MLFTSDFHNVTGNVTDIYTGLILGALFDIQGYGGLDLVDFFPLSKAAVLLVFRGRIGLVTFSSYTSDGYNFSFLFSSNLWVKFFICFSFSKIVS